MLSYKSSGIILNNFNIKDKSRIVKVYTRDFGRIDLIYSGKNNLKNEIISLDIFNEVYIEFYEYGEYFYLSEIDVKASNYKIRNNNLKITFGNIVLEILDKIFPMQFADKKIFELTSAYFSNLQNSNNANLLTVGYLLKFLAYNGYKIDFSNVINADNIQSQEYYFSLDDFNIYCEIRQKGYNIYTLSYGQIKLLNVLMYYKFSNFPNIEYEDNFYLLDMLIKTIKNIFDISKINSMKFLGFYKKGL